MGCPIALNGPVLRSPLWLLRSYHFRISEFLQYLSRLQFSHTTDISMLSLLKIIFAVDVLKCVSKSPVCDSDYSRSMNLISGHRNSWETHYQQFAPENLLELHVRQKDKAQLSEFFGDYLVVGLQKRLCSVGEFHSTREDLEFA